MKEKEIKVALLTPQTPPVFATVENTLEKYQSLVGGLIDVFEIENGLNLIFNDEGKFNGSQPNRALTFRDIGEDRDEFFDIIYGNIVVTGNDREGNFCSLTSEQEQAVKDRFSHIEFYSHRTR